MTEPSQSLPIGVEAIRAALATMPGTPGVYRMMNTAGEVLYIGKAKNLKNRVSNYASPSNLSTRILRMVSQVTSVEILTCGSEAEALLLEASLVKRHRPRYNILLKDDKSFPYLFIDGTHPFPRIAKHRGAQSAKGEYFGPFASAGALNDALATLQKVFLLRPCADSIFVNRTRPCLQYQIKRCSAPCVGYVSEAQYREQLTSARNFLRGKHRDVQEAFAQHMQVASDAQEYEKAALYRDRIRALTQVQQEQRIHAAGLIDADLIVLARQGARSVVQVFFYRQGNHFGHQSFHPRHEAEDSDADVMASFLGLFYQSHTPPEEILVNIAPSEMELLQDALKLRAGYAVELRVPQRGDKRLLVEQAVLNAQAALQREEMQRASIAEHLARLAELFELKKSPARIEIYDNSHIMGTHALGAMVVATPEGFDKRSYRTFNIKDITTTPGDDYAMMREVMRRRFKGVTGDAWRVAREDDHPSPVTRHLSPLPDLLLIDGGQGQLSAVMEVMAELGLQDLPLVAIAKGVDRNAGREWFFLPHRAPFQLPEQDATLHYLQRLRDEAHRFAIGKHRARRSKSLSVSTLDDISGIGQQRKRALLTHFGSRAAVERATLDELTRVEGISQKIAQTIYDYFHG